MRNGWQENNQHLSCSSFYRPCPFFKQKLVGNAKHSSIQTSQRKRFAAFLWEKKVSLRRRSEIKSHKNEPKSFKEQQKEKFSKTFSLIFGLVLKLFSWWYNIYVFRLIRCISEKIDIRGMSAFFLPVSYIMSLFSSAFSLIQNNKPF